MIRHVLADWPEWGLAGPMPQSGQCRALPNGLTNRCWRLDLEEQSVVVRVSAANTRLLDIDREREYRLQQWAAGHGLAPAVLYRAPSDRYWVMEYATGRAADLNVDLQSLAGVLRQLHGLPPPAGISTWQLVDKAEAYWRTLQWRLHGQWHGWELLKADLQSVMSDAQTLEPEQEYSVCHLDAHPQNWRLTADGWQLLDWEYATLGPSRWDVAGFVQASELNAEQTARWCHLHDMDLHSPVWRRTCLQLQYLAELWFGVQGMKSCQQLEQALRQLLDDARA